MAVRVHYHVTSVCRTLGLQPMRWHEKVKKKSQKNSWMALFLDESYMCQNFRALLR